jgi:glycosyltransferase involved in cell wall biosynthesis
MKIALLSFEYPTETGFGGIGTYTWYQARALARLGHEVHVLAGATEPCQLRREDHDGVIVYRHRVDSPWNRLARWLERGRLWWTKNRIENAFSMKDGLQRLLETNDYDVIEMPECGAEGAFLGRYFQVPTVIKFHSPAKIIMPTYSVPKLDRLICPILENRALRGASALTSCSQFLAHEAERQLPVKLPIDVVPNGIDLDLFDQGDSIDMRGREGIPAGRKIILFCGRLERRKGIHVMKEVAARILREREVAFVFAGQDLFEYGKRSLEPALRRSAKRGSYHLLGRLTLPEVRSCLKQADIFVMPSLWENCPYSCLEAMAAGRAIVCSDAGGLPELIHHQENGLMARVENVEEHVSYISRLLDDANLAACLGDAARNTVEKSFTDSVIAEQSLACYREAISRHPSSPPR